MSDPIVATDDDDDVFVRPRQRRRRDSDSSFASSASDRSPGSSPRQIHVLPLYLSTLIDERAFYSSSPTRWFSVERFRQAAEEIRQLCLVDQYVLNGVSVPLRKRCECLIPQVPDRTGRPEKKLTQTFGITQEQFVLISNNRGSGTGRFSNSSLSVVQKSANVFTLTIRKSVRMVYIMYMAHYGIPPQDGLELSHFCHNGNEGCINPIHIGAESKEINLDRRNCWRVFRCAAANCNGDILGNPCQGHVGSNILCLRGAVSSPCPHYTEH